MKTRRKWQHALFYFLTSSAVLLFPLSSLLKSLLEKSNASKISYTNISRERDNLQKGYILSEGMEGKIIVNLYNILVPCVCIFFVFTGTFLNMR